MEPRGREARDPSVIVSVVICTRDRAASLRETLASLAGVEVPPALPTELVVVDNGSTDDTEQVVEAFTPTNGIAVHYVFEPRSGKSRALNTGLSHAKGHIFLFSDDDVRFPPDWIQGMCRPVLEDDVDVVQGGIRWAPHLFEASGQSVFLASILTSTEHKGHEELSTALIGANMALTRRAYEKVGAFDEELGPGALGLGEETLLGWQLARCGSIRANALDVQVEHHFDQGRITRSGLLEVADRKGRSTAYIDYHWKHVRESWLRSRMAALVIKDLIRTALAPAAWPTRTPIPEWKYGYRSSLSRLRQLSVEMKRTHNYTFMGVHKVDGDISRRSNLVG